jgi:GxxExxY protein
MEERILYKDLSYSIVAAAIQVWKTLGFGFLEKVYENSLVIELRKRGVPCEQQKHLQVFYDGQNVGDYATDIVVEDKIILELKSAKAIDDSHIAQTLHYLKATGLRLGIILSFGPEKMDYKRVIL